MDCEYFIKKLFEISPTQNDLRFYNLSDEEVDNLIRSFQCVSKQNNAPTFSGDPIIDLLQNYDCSNYVVGLIRFEKQALEKIEYYLIGHVEMDLLVIDKLSLQILVLDYQNPNYIIWKSALNTSCFLEALLVCSLFFSRSIISPNPIDRENAFMAVEECVVKSGGEDYRPFYEMLLLNF